MEAYDRFLRSLRASSRKIGKAGRIILVANGTEHAAELPDNVLRDVQLSPSVSVMPITLQANARNVGGLNAGIAAALAFPHKHGEEWIGQGQSSVVLQRGWCQALYKSAQTDFDAVYGRLVSEDEPASIWADGHVIESGLPRNVHFDVPTMSGPEAKANAYPCLSAV